MAKVVKLGQYKNIEVEAPLREVSQEEVEQQVQAILTQNVTFVDKEGTVENGDMTIIDFEGFKDGVAFDGGKAEGYQLEIGSHSFIPGFEEQMIGMAKEETRELNLTFPENYGAKELAGADVIFKVTVHNIQTKKEAVLNDEFVVSLGNPSLKSVDDLYQAVRGQLENQCREEHARMIEDKAFDLLLNESEVEVEEADIEDALNKHIHLISQQMMSQGMPLEQYLQMVGMTNEMLREQLRPNAISQAKYVAIIDEIAKVENIVVSDEEINQYFEMVALQTQKTKEELMKDLNLDEFKFEFTRYKSSQLIMTSVVVK